jgi:hypothetical protein
MTAELSSNRPTPTESLATGAGAAVTEPSDGESESESPKKSSGSAGSAMPEVAAPETAKTFGAPVSVELRALAVAVAGPHPKDVLGALALVAGAVALIYLLRPHRSVEDPQ